MKKEKCARCGKRAGFRKSYEKIKYSGYEFYLCVDCSQIAYKMKDAIKAKDTALAADLEHVFLTLPKEKNAVLSEWFDVLKINAKL